MTVAVRSGGCQAAGLRNGRRQARGRAASAWSPRADRRQHRLPRLPPSRRQGPCRPGVAWASCSADSSGRGSSGTLAPCGGPVSRCTHFPAPWFLARVPRGCPPTLPPAATVCGACPTPGPAPACPAPRGSFATQAGPWVLVCKLHEARSLSEAPPCPRELPRVRLEPSAVNGEGRGARQEALVTGRPPCLLLLPCRRDTWGCEGQDQKLHRETRSKLTAVTVPGAEQAL